MSPARGFRKPCGHGEEARHSKTVQRNGRLYEITYCRPCETLRERQRRRRAGAVPGEPGVPIADAVREFERFIVRYRSRQQAALAYAERFGISPSSAVVLFFNLAHGYQKYVQRVTYERLGEMS